MRIWMLTGDKAETAICIGISARLIDKTQQVFSLLVTNKRYTLTLHLLSTDDHDMLAPSLRSWFIAMRLVNWMSLQQCIIHVW
jgi:magnesium-transporting ATPase (P-type)